MCEAQGNNAGAITNAAAETLIRAIAQSKLYITDQKQVDAWCKTPTGQHICGLIAERRRMRQEKAVGVGGIK